MGINVRNDRIIISGKQEKGIKQELAASEMDWAKFAVWIVFYVFSFCSVEPTEENPNPVATLNEEQVELIKKVIAGTEVLMFFNSHL